MHMDAKGYMRPANSADQFFCSVQMTVSLEAFLEIGRYLLTAILDMCISFMLCSAAFKAQRPAALRRAVSVRVKASADDKFADCKPTTAFFFPGQGAQSVGMAKDLVAECPAAKELFDKAADILGYDLLQVCVEGPKEKLDKTAVSQVKQLA
eukprot:gene6040-6278_t